MVTQKTCSLYSKASDGLRTVANFFTRLKDATPWNRISGVVYHVPCADCEQCYVGQTGNYLVDRLKQHELDVKNKREKSALSQHCLQLGHNMDFDDARVLHHKVSLRERLFFEMVGIANSANTMNLRSDVDGLSNIYSYLLHLDYSRKETDQNSSGSLFSDVSELYF